MSSDNILRRLLDEKGFDKMVEILSKLDDSDRWELYQKAVDDSAMRVTYNICQLRKKLEEDNE